MFSKGNKARVYQFTITLNDDEVEDVEEFIAEFKEQFPNTKMELTSNQIIASGSVTRELHKVKYMLLLNIGRTKDLVQCEHDFETDTDLNVVQDKQDDIGGDRSNGIDSRKDVSAHTSSVTETSTSDNPKLASNGDTSALSSVTSTVLPSHIGHVNLYTLDKGLKVLVYHGNILQINVEAIVNPTNTILTTSGLLSAKILRAAGQKVDKEMKEILKKDKEVLKNSNCVTSAGALNYKNILHTVGPQWAEYRPHDEEKVRKCEEDLSGSIYLCLIKADEIGLKSLGFPCIGAGKAQVPRAMCCVQYARAVLDFDSQRTGSTSLQEVHFCDTNLDLVKSIQTTFDTMIVNKKEPDYNYRQFVKRKASSSFWN